MQPKKIPLLASPNFNQRPQDTNIDMIVLHAISLPDGEFETTHIHDFFLNQLVSTAHPSFSSLQDVKVSAHFVIARNGSITQFVKTSDRAWHAGKSSWEGHENCNDFSIGIEIIGDERQPFTKKQYTETARLCKTLLVQYPQIEKTRIVGHQDIAPSRKWDPGKQWDWSRFRKSLSHIKYLLDSVV